MIGNRIPLPASAKPEAEKPFWISYADLMTAMMTLFLAAMAVTMVVVTRKVEEKLSAETIRAREVLQICEAIQRDLAGNQTIQVDCADNRINFGEAGRFAHDDYRLPAAGGSALRDLVPVVLRAANGELGRKWFKQVIIEGFTDTDGSYLYNLHLSLQRSEWVMCMLLDPTRNNGLQFADEQLRQIRELFLAGGVSFNSPKDSKEESRRVELRLQFYGLSELSDKEAPPAFDGGTAERCMLL